MQPILVAAGGGGGSAVLGPSLSPDAQGLVNPWDTMEHWRALVTKEDVDAGKLLKCIQSCQCQDRESFL